MQTSTAAPPARRRGCGCGGAPGTATGAFVRPRFFAGQLLTEDDLQALTAYVTGKDRLRNRALSGAGVVCGLEVACDPCGGGTVTVRPGYALDCCGNDIVVGCREQVDVLALVHDLRVRSLGVDCGDPCDGNHGAEGGARRYGLYVRYTEEPAEPVAAYATGESCPTDGCTPSRIRESFRFVVRCELAAHDHRYRPGDRLAARLGDVEALAGLRDQAHLLGWYGRTMLAAVHSTGRPVPFDAATADRYGAAMQALPGLSGQPGAAEARELTEHVRGLAGALASLDLHPPGERERLIAEHDLDVEAARAALGAAAEALRDTAADARVWPAPWQRKLAASVLAEAARVAQGEPDGPPLATRLAAQGTPLTYDMRAHVTADAHRVRNWLLMRLETGAETTDCAVRQQVAGLAMPRPLPGTTAGDRVEAGAAELATAGRAGHTLAAALRGYLVDAVRASLLPPCGDCADSDVLLAVVEVDDCAVTRIDAAGRAQWLPGGPGYAAWAPALYEARALADRLDPERPGEPGMVAPAYAIDLLAGPPADGDLDRLLDLLADPVPAAGTPPSGPPAGPPADESPTAESPTAESPAAGPAPGAGAATQGELADLRGQLGELTDLVARLRAEVREATATAAAAADAAHTVAALSAGGPEPSDVPQPPAEPEQSAPEEGAPEDGAPDEPRPPAKKTPGKKATPAKNPPPAKKAAPAKSTAPRRSRGQRPGNQES